MMGLKKAAPDLPSSLSPPRRSMLLEIIQSALENATVGNADLILLKSKDYHTNPNIELTPNNQTSGKAADATYIRQH